MGHYGNEEVDSLNSIEQRFWPFELPATHELSGIERDQVHFLEQAFELGFRPYMFGSENFAATFGKNGAMILCRGSKGKHWELLLVSDQHSRIELHVNQFAVASRTALKWLMNADVDVVYAQTEGSLIEMPSKLD